MKDTSTPGTSRRQFLRNSLKAGALLPFLGAANLSLGQESQTLNFIPDTKPLHPLKILILGGTSFLGPHQIAYALGRGHEITTFTRGKTQPSIHKKLFKEVEQLVGDRNDNLEALKGRKWDAVIDNSGRRVQWTKDTAELLKDNVGLYLYTSSTGVYYPYLGKDIKEDTELLTVSPPGTEGEEKLEYDYGVMKTNSELAAQAAFGKDRTIIVRPTYMIGPADRTNRFAYWPVRLKRGGKVMVPGNADDAVQYIDVRDVAEFMIRLIEQGAAGTYNGVGPASAQGMHAFIHAAHAAFSSPLEIVAIDDYEFLKKQEVYYIVPWIMPEGKNAGSALINNQHAIASGLTFRPLARTVWDIDEWWESDAVSEERRQKLLSGLMSREEAIIKDWLLMKR